MPDAFSKKPTSLNRLHNRFATTSHSKSSAHDFLSVLQEITNYMDPGGSAKVVVKDDDEEDNRFHDNESDSSAAVSEFDSSSLKRLQILFTEKGRHIKQHPSSSHSVINEKFNQQKPVEVYYCATPNDFSENSEYIRGRHVNNQVGKVLSSKSFIYCEKNEKFKDIDGDDDDCVVTSGQKFVQKVESKHVKLFLDSDDSNKIHVSSDDTKDFTSENEGLFSVSNPKLKFSLPSKIANMLYPHQHQGLKWLWSLHCKGKGGILGDDMGLGKTMQICGFLAGLFHSNLIKRVLVVAPKTLLPHWLKELGVVGLSQNTRVFFGTCSKARHYELRCILQDKGVLLTTYDIVRSNDKSLSGHYDQDAVTWDYMILDEGHLIKNPSTQRAQSFLAIPCGHRIIVSGTPLQNNLKELWALFNFCCPRLLGNKECFKYKYERPILRGNNKNASDVDKCNGSAAAQDLRKRIQPYFLRRLKSDVFSEDGATNTVKLSKKNEIVVWLRLSTSQRQLYKNFLNSGIALSAYYNSPLAALTILKKICDHPLLLTKRAAEDVLEGLKSLLNQEDHGVAEKLAIHMADAAERYDIGENNDILSCKISFILSLLDNLIPGGHNVLIFSQTRIMLNLVQDSLDARGFKFMRIDGTTKASDRLKIVDEFQEGIGAPIFLLTSKVGGLGLTLTKADRVIVVDPDWNPSIDNQCADRAYRIGQKKDVIVYRLMTCGTVEEKIYRKQIFKEGLFKSATEDKEQISYFSWRDLKEFFSLPKQGFDVSLTQQQLHEEHDCEHKMDSSLKVHVEFLKSLGIAGISHHSLLFSKTAPVPVVKHRINRLPYVFANKKAVSMTRRSCEMQNQSWAQATASLKFGVKEVRNEPRTRPLVLKADSEASIETSTASKCRNQYQSWEQATASLKFGVKEVRNEPRTRPLVLKADSEASVETSTASKCRNQYQSWEQATASLKFGVKEVRNEPRTRPLVLKADSEASVETSTASKCRNQYQSWEQATASLKFGVKEVRNEPRTRPLVLKADSEASVETSTASKCRNQYQSWEQATPSLKFGVKEVRNEPRTRPLVLKADSEASVETSTASKCRNQYQSWEQATASLKFGVKEVRNEPRTRPLVLKADSEASVETSTASKCRNQYQSWEQATASLKFGVKEVRNEPRTRPLVLKADSEASVETSTASKCRNQYQSWEQATASLKFGVKEVRNESRTRPLVLKADSEASVETSTASKSRVLLQKFRQLWRSFRIMGRR